MRKMTIVGGLSNRCTSWGLGQLLSFFGCTTISLISRHHHHHLVEASCNWIYFSKDAGARSNYAYSNLSNRLKATVGFEASPVSSLVNATTLEGADVFFDHAAEGNPPLSNNERDNLMAWLTSSDDSSSRKSMIISGHPAGLTASFNYLGGLAGNNVTCEPFTQITTAENYTVSIAEGAKDETLVQGLPSSFSKTIRGCSIKTPSSNVKPILVGTTTIGIKHVIVAMEDPGTGSSTISGRIIYVGDYMLWNSRSITPDYYIFQENLISAACTVDYNVTNDVTVLPWQIVNTKDKNGDLAIKASLLSSSGDGNSSTNNNHAVLLNIMQIVRTTGQPDVRYQLYESDCTTPLEARAISSNPSLLQESITDAEPSSNDDKLVTSTFELNITEVQSLANVWTNHNNGDGGTVSICTVVELMSDDDSTTANADSIYMLETIITATIDLVANIVMSTTAADVINVDVLDQADQATSSVSIEGNVLACHCDDGTATCYSADTGGPALSQGNVLNICLKFPNGFDSGTIQSMSISQSASSAANGGGGAAATRASSQVIINDIALASYTTIGQSPLGSPTDLIVTTMVSVDFFRFQSNETNRSAGLPPITVTGSVSFGESNVLDSANDRRRRQLKKERSHAFVVEVNVVPYEDSSFPVMKTTMTNKEKEDISASSSGSITICKVFIRSAFFVGAIFVLLAY